jgi:thiol-disulfide isomerase/thioredoxin
MTRRNLVIVAAMLCLSCGTANALKVGDTAPDFTRTDVAGKPVQLSKYRGRLVLLNFWASWCAPCREEMPLFSKEGLIYPPLLRQNTGNGGFAG